MNGIRGWFFIGIFYLLAFHLHGQTVQGIVTDRASGLPLAGATVYFDGTMTVAITGDSGEFRLAGAGNSTTLVVSFVGYQTVRLESVSQYEGRRLRIELDLDTETLGEVVIAKSPFSRKEMLAAFRRQFLGNSPAAKSCVIENEQDLHFYYNSKDNSLTATARKPLVIRNKHLKYDVHFDLIEQVTFYKQKSLSPHHVNTSYFAGSTLYYDLSNNGNADKRRAETYQGSAVHLMRTIAGNLWEQEGFSLMLHTQKLNPADYFGIGEKDNKTEITLLKKLMVKATEIEGSTTVHLDDKEVEVYFTILHRDRISLLQFRETAVHVDRDGNYSPVYGVLFGGYIGSLKAGDMLPRDYYSTTLAKQIKKE